MAKNNPDSFKTASVIVYCIMLFALWFLLSGFLKPLLLFFGLVSVAFVLWMSVRSKSLNYDVLPLKLFFKLPIYWLWLIKEIIKSGLITTKIIWKGEYNPVLFKVRSSQKSATGKANYANEITLTPGTVTIEVDKDTFLVHALSKNLSDDLKSGEMDKLITDLHR